MYSTDLQKIGFHFGKSNTKWNFSHLKCCFVQQKVKLNYQVSVWLYQAFKHCYRPLSGGLHAPLLQHFKLRGDRNGAGGGYWNWECLITASASEECLKLNCCWCIRRVVCPGAGGSLNAVDGTRPWKLESRFYRLWADISLLLWANVGSRLQGLIQPSRQWEQGLTWSEREPSDSLLFSAKCGSGGTPSGQI